MHRENIRVNTKITHTTWTWLAATFHSKKLRYHLRSDWCSYRFFSIKRLIQLWHTNEIQYCYALGASFRNLCLKTSNYYAKHCYQKSFGLKQDVQNLVGRRRPFGAPLPTRPCVFLVSFAQWPNPFTARWATACVWKNHVRLKCSYTTKTQNGIKWSSGCFWWIPIVWSRIPFPREPSVVQQYSMHLFLLDMHQLRVEPSPSQEPQLESSRTGTVASLVLIFMLLPLQLFISPSWVERLTFLHIKAHGNISIYFALGYHRESLRNHSRQTSYSTTHYIKQFWSDEMIPKTLSGCCSTRLILVSSRYSCEVA